MIIGVVIPVAGCTGVSECDYWGGGESSGGKCWCLNRGRRAPVFILPTDERRAPTDPHPPHTGVGCLHSPLRTPTHPPTILPLFTTHPLHYTTLPTHHPASTLPRPAPHPHPAPQTSAAPPSAAPLMMAPAAGSPAACGRPPSALSTPPSSARSARTASCTASPPPAGGAWWRGGGPSSGRTCPFEGGAGRGRGVLAGAGNLHPHI